MKTCNLLMAGLLIFANSGVLLNAADQTFQKAVVVSADPHTKILPNHSKATDAPPPETQYAHDVSLRLGCTVYVVRYRSQIDYLPAVFAAGQTVEIRPAERVVYAKIPGDKDARMSIIRREDVKGDSACPATSSQASR
jgi:hypothetical protein